jgi:hypothetical protein
MTFKSNYQCYLNYLLKTPEEKNLICTDAKEPSWAILGDRGYIGPDTDTPDLRRVKMIKNSTFRSEINRNSELEKIRVPIECWFGRLKKLWKFTRETYKLDHRNFDEHFEILALLTNEQIRVSSDDQKYYKIYLQMRRAQYEACKEERRTTNKESKCLNKKPISKVFS